MAKIHKNKLQDKNFVLVDFGNHRSHESNRASHLHTYKEIPDPQGNRAERRAAKKFRKKS